MSDFEAEFMRRSALAHALAMAPCLQDYFLEMRETAEASLIRHLPGLRAEDRDWVEPEQIHALAGALDPASPTLTLALLAALSRIGDGHVISQVQALHWQLAQNTGAHSARLRTAAAECLICLRENAARARQAQTLLRGSEAPKDEAQSLLLRPAGATFSSAREELVRAEPDPIVPKPER